MPGRDRCAGRKRSRSRGCPSSVSSTPRRATSSGPGSRVGGSSRSSTARSAACPRGPHVPFGQVPAIAFFAYAVLALLALHPLDAGPLVSLLRVIHTFLLAFLAASMIETRRDLRLVLAGLVAGAVIGILVAAFSGGNLLSASVQGELGKNPLGLVSGLLLLLALFSRWNPKWGIRWRRSPVFGLVIAKSVGSFVAAGVTVALGAVLATPARTGHRGAIRRDASRWRWASR